MTAIFSTGPSAGRCLFSSLRNVLLLPVVAAVLCACAHKAPVAPSAEKAPVRIAEPYVTPYESPETFVSRMHAANQDLHSWKELDGAVGKSLDYVRRKPSSSAAVCRGGLVLTWGEMKDTLVLLRSLLPRLDAEPGLLNKNFEWLRVDGGIKYSSYYEPELKASRTPKPGLIPLYGVPSDLKSYKASHGGRYYSRREIDGGGVLKGRGLELAWADPVDVYFLQIQGSGRLVYDDGSRAIVNYAAQNGHKYKSSGRSLRDFGVRLQSGDIIEQREWFKKHPDRINEILFDNPSYVFFKFGGKGAVGAIGEVVEGWASLATDPSFLPLGSVVMYGVNAPDPDLGRLPLRGLGFAQDTGGAIKWNRIDIFSGSSPRSVYVASKLDASGPAWVLVSREAREAARGRLAELRAAGRARSASASAAPAGGQAGKSAGRTVSTSKPAASKGAANKKSPDAGSSKSGTRASGKAPSAADQALASLRSGKTGGSRKIPPAGRKRSGR